METTASRARPVLIGGAITLTVVLLLVLPVYVVVRTFADLNMNYRCERHPPEETFRRFVSPDLTGISEIRAMGHSSLGGANLFLCFRATPEALQRLLREYEAPEIAEAGDNGTEQIAEDAEFWLRFNQPRSYLHRIGLEELRKVRRPLIYEKRGSAAGESTTTLAVDRARKLVYIYHMNI